MLNLTYTFCRTYAPPLLSLSGIRLSDLLWRDNREEDTNIEERVSHPKLNQVEQRIHAQHNLIGERMTSLVISSQNNFLYYGFLIHSKEEVFRSTRLNKFEILLLFRKPYSLLDDTRNESQQGPISPDLWKEKKDMQLACGLLKGSFLPSLPASQYPLLEKNPRHLFTDKKNR